MSEVCLKLFRRMRGKQIERDETKGASRIQQLLSCEGNKSEKAKMIVVGGDAVGIIAARLLMGVDGVAGPRLVVYKVE